jgi:hypothetical protein
MRRRTAAALAALVLWTSSAAGGTALLSKTYVFQPGAILNVGAEVEAGVRLDTVRFLVPETVEGEITRTAGHVQAEVALSNTGSATRRVGVAIALFDDDGRLLAVASGGDRVFPLKAGRQAVYTLTFDHVNGQAAKATRFQITVETRS